MTDIYTLVESMRAQQKRYYRSRSQLDLIESKKLEKMVDDCLIEEREERARFTAEGEGLETLAANEKQERFRNHAKTVAKMARVVMAELLKDPDPAWRELAKDLDHLAARFRLNRERLADVVRFARESEEAK